MNSPARAFISDTALVVDAINAMADSLAPELLPNGRRNGTKWMFSGIADTGQSESAWVNLSGPRTGHWCDMGNAASGEERGDMIDLLRLKLGLSQRDAFEEARRRLGMPSSGAPVPMSQAEKQRRAEEARQRAEARERDEQAERERKAKRAKFLWVGAQPIAGTPASRYLKGRGLRPGPTGVFPNSYRFAPEAFHPEVKEKLPALVMCIVTAEGQHIGTHRVFLAQDDAGRWGKLRRTFAARNKAGEWINAPATAKMIMGNFWGGFIPVNKGKSGKSMRDMPEGEPIYVCEGPEDAVAIRMIKPDARIICSVSLPNIGAILLPRQARELVIVADRDEKPTARDALEVAIAKQQARGIDVGIVMPPREAGGRPVKDINDWVLALTSATGRAV
jgi:hypothetical protein